MMNAFRPWLFWSVLACAFSTGNASRSTQSQNLMHTQWTSNSDATNVTDNATVSPFPTISPAPTMTPTNSTTSPEPTVSPAPTKGNATESPAPSSPPTEQTPYPTISPAPSTSAPTTKAPTLKPTPAPIAPTKQPHYHPHDDGDKKNHPSLLRILGKTIAWLFIIALALLFFGFLMSNRYRIYYYVRSAWFRFLRWDGTQWVLRKTGLGRLLNIHPNESSSLLNEVILDNDLNEGLLLQST